MTRLAAGLLAVSLAPGIVRADEKDDTIALLRAQLEAVKKRNFELEDRAVKLAVEVEEAKREALKAANAAKSALAIAEDKTKQIEELRSRLLGRLPLAPAPRPKGWQPVALPDSLRGTVSDVTAGVLTLDIGLDAGLAVGAVLEVYRLEGGGRYLGTAKVVKVLPKEAVATFTPARDVPLNRLKPDELPRKGDAVGAPQPNP